ncbi:hypothetical protein [Microbacterium sp. SORGH_AS_0421]|nr:hypothetical protein [Microbacterium sp. SORGH_AS_0421]MDQ1175394.1 hypothetical protein [Microbacterium sp. SORGH_AS_0421]
MTFFELVELLRQGIEIMLQAIEDGWNISRPWLHDGAQRIADKLAG